ncbi:MAG: hypothetical protein ACR2PT_03405 [Endozoicomonas sp.]
MKHIICIAILISCACCADDNIDKYYNYMKLDGLRKYIDRNTNESFYIAFDTRLSFSFDDGVTKNLQHEFYNMVGNLDFKIASYGVYLWFGKQTDDSKKGMWISLDESEGLPYKVVFMFDQINPLSIDPNMFFSNYNPTHILRYEPRDELKDHFKEDLCVIYNNAQKTLSTYRISTKSKKYPIYYQLHDEL